jgi:hypothetical protein
MPPDRPDCRWRCPAMVEAASVHPLLTAGLVRSGDQDRARRRRCARHDERSSGVRAGDGRTARCRYVRRAPGRSEWAVVRGVDRRTGGPRGGRVRRRCWDVRVSVTAWACGGRHAALASVAAAACRRVRKLMADADLLAWLDDLPRTAATGEVLRMRDEYGTRFAEPGPLCGEPFISGSRRSASATAPYSTRTAPIAANCARQATRSIPVTGRSRGAQVVQHQFHQGGRGGGCRGDR